MLRYRWLLLAGMFWFSVGSWCEAGKFNARLNLGDPAPAWQQLPGTDGKSYSLSDFADARLVVVIFSCNHCPVARAYEDRLIKMQKEFQERGVQFVAICCNNSDADRLPAMIDHAKSRGLNYPYLHDESQQSARDYGAMVTPEVFVLDGKRRVAYMGGIDDSWDKPSAIKHHYLRDAIEALLQGNTPPATETRPKGCGIQFDE